jgi:hypothetical protein
MVLNGCFHMSHHQRQSQWCEIGYVGNSHGGLSLRPATPFTDVLMKTDQAEFELRKMVKEMGNRQNDQDILNTPFNNGVTGLTRLTGH